MNGPITWHQVGHLWVLLFAAGIGWDCGRAIYRLIIGSLHGLVAYLEQRRRPRRPDPRTALRALIGMVDQMDRVPSRGGGVLPVDKARIMHDARKAAGL